MQIYLDLVIGLNTMVDFFLLSGTGSLAGKRGKYGRIWGAALLGGIYGGVCMLPEFGFLGNLLWRMVCVMLMVWIAFGWDRQTPQLLGLFLLLSMALGGLAQAVNHASIPMLLACGGLLWLLCRVAFRQENGEMIPLQIHYKGRCFALTALRDTGNRLRDPVTGKAVLVISAQTAADITGLTGAELRDPLATMAKGKITGLRLIPYYTVGGNGLMLGMSFSDVRIGGHKMRSVIAFAPADIGGDGTFQALMGGTV